VTDRREFIKGAAIAGAGLALKSSRLLGQDLPEKPNVLLFMVDQMRQPRWFSPEAKLPNFELLKSRGIEFTRHFVSAVPCSPSRACLLTGLHIEQHGIKVNVGGEDQASLDPAIPCLGHLFRRAGYQTPYFGKWHLTKAKALKKDKLDAYGFDYLTEERAGRTGLLADGSWAQSAIDWLSDPKNQDNPWFALVSLLNPHDICGYNPYLFPDTLIPNPITSLPDNLNDDLVGKPSCQGEFQDLVVPGNMGADDEKQWLNYLNYYYYLTLKIDTLLGRVLETLEKTGQLQNTIIIFTSDHGEMGGSHRLSLKGPFVYDENTNVPLVISWPGKLAQGVQANALCQNVDIFPTLAAILGVNFKTEFPYLPGKNLAPILQDPQTGAVNYHLLFSFTENVAAEEKRERAGKSWIQAPHQIRSIRERNRVYARYFDPALPDQEFELYDLVNDPLQMNNVALDPAYKAVREEMAEKLRIAENEEMAPVEFTRLRP